MNIKKSTRTENTFEMIATYFVKDFYIKLYNKALELRNNRESISITDGYIKIVGMYVQSLKNIDNYKILFNSLITDIIEWSNSYSNLRYVDCIDKIAIEFMPEDYIDVTTLMQKQLIIKDVLLSFISNAINKVIDNISYVIDNRTEEDGINLLRDEFISLLYIEKEKIIKRFVISENNDGKISHNQLNMKVIEDFKKHIKELVEEKVATKKHMEKLNQVKNQLLNKIVDLEKKINELSEINNTLKSENNKLSEQLDNNNKVIETYKNTIAEKSNDNNNLNSLSNLIPITNLNSLPPLIEKDDDEYENKNESDNKNNLDNDDNNNINNEEYFNDLINNL